MAIMIFLMGVLCIRYFNVQRHTGFIPNAGIVVFKNNEIKNCLDCTYKVKIFFFKLITIKNRSINLDTK